MLHCYNHLDSTLALTLLNSEERNCNVLRLLVNTLLMDYRQHVGIPLHCYHISHLQFHFQVAVLSCSRFKITQNLL